MKTLEFILRVDDNLKQSMKAIARELQVYEAIIRCAIREDLRQTSYVKRRGRQFSSEKAKDNCLSKAKRLVNKLKHKESQKSCSFLQMGKTFSKSRKGTEKRS